MLICSVLALLLVSTGRLGSRDETDSSLSLSILFRAGSEKHATALFLTLVLENRTRSRGVLYSFEDPSRRGVAFHDLS